MYAKVDQKRVVMSHIIYNIVIISYLVRGITISLNHRVYFNFAQPLTISYNLFMFVIILSIL